MTTGFGPSELPTRGQWAQSLTHVYCRCAVAQRKCLNGFNDLIAVSLHFSLFSCYVPGNDTVAQLSTLLHFLLVQSVYPKCIVPSDIIQMKSANFKTSHAIVVE